MAQFDESKIINALHPEKAEVGKKYWVSDNLLELKRCVEENDTFVMELAEVKKTEDECVFNFVSGCTWQFLYPYEEPPKQRMTHKMLTEWCTKVNGQYKYKGTEDALIHSIHEYYENDEEKEIDKEIVIRPFGYTEWIEPTTDIYERDCKKEN